MLPIEVDQTAVATTLRAVRSKFIVTLTALLLVLSAMPAAAADDDELVAPQADPGASLFPASENEEPRPDLDLVASGFSSPVFVDAPKGDTRLFVVELGGKIEIIENGSVLGTPFLTVDVGSWPPGSLPIVGWNPQFVDDFNGDGRDDIANYFPANDSWWVSRSSGSAFTKPKWG